jgi:hypothetical protein
MFVYNEQDEINVYQKNASPRFTLSYIWMLWEAVTILRTLVDAHVLVQVVTADELPFTPPDRTYPCYVS